MTITITEKEYNAICQALDQVTTDYEAASDEIYLKTMGDNIDLIKNVIKKYKRARYKANEFQSILAVVAAKNRGRCVLARDIDKITRNLIKKLKERGEL